MKAAPDCDNRAVTQALRYHYIITTASKQGQPRHAREIVKDDIVYSLTRSWDSAERNYCKLRSVSLQVHYLPCPSGLPLEMSCIIPGIPRYANPWLEVANQYQELTPRNSVWYS